MSTTKTQMAPSTSITSPSSSSSSSNESDIPQLTYTIAQTTEEKRDALRLVADTIAQQRQVASTAIIFHPAVLAPFAALLSALIYRSRHDTVGAVILVAGVLVAYLAAVQYFTYGYLQRAEAFNWKAFIAAKDGAQEEDTVMYARYGDSIIAALVLRLDRAAKTGSKASRKNGDGRSTARIRAWATRLRYRGTGVGGDMLRNAVAFARSTLGSEATIEFSEPHAHTVDTTKRFTAPFARREARARKALAQAIEDVEAAAE